jgi:hypothetical protein
MSHSARPHKAIDFIGLFLAFILIGSVLSSCEQTCYDGELNNGEKMVDCGGPCVICDTTIGTCFDGLQNQGEEGVDCGGPCNACITDTIITSPMFLCNGTGGPSYFPLSVNSYWIYVLPGNDWMQLEITETVTQNNGESYAHMVTTGAFGIIHDYYRESGGEILRWNTTASIDEVYIPARPFAGQQWTTTSSDSVVVVAIDAALNSQNGCSYAGLLQLTIYANGTATSINYYKKGLGLVQLSSVAAILDSAVVF